MFLANNRTHRTMSQCRAERINLGNSELDLKFEDNKVVCDRDYAAHSTSVCREKS